jgi:predicted peptidase
MFLPKDTSAPADPFDDIGQKVCKIPAWVFHGQADPVVPIDQSRQMVAVLLSLGDEVRNTEYPGVGHNSWNEAYADPQLLKWLLSHKLKK